MISRQKIGEWYFAVGRTKKGERFWAWCAKTPDLGDTPLDPSGEVHFELGDSAEEALFLLKKSVLH